MAIRDIFRVSRKTFFNPLAWLGYDALKEQTLTIRSFLKSAVAVEKPERTESFKEAEKRLGLKDKEVKSSATLYLAYSLFFLAVAFCDLIYALYLIFHHHAFLALVVALSVCALLLAQAFKYHFWYFQIKHRKLGTSFKEWYQKTFKVKARRGGS